MDAPHSSFPVPFGQSQKAQGDRLEFEAVLGNSLDGLTRYQSQLKRDLYRAIETLRRIQAERVEQKDGV